MKPMTQQQIEAEAKFAKQAYRDRARINKKAQEILAAGSTPVTIRLGKGEIELAKQQAEAKGLRYQTYVKMLLHEALRAAITGRTARRAR